MTRAVHVPYTVEQDEDGVWCAHAQLRPGVGANGEGDTPEAAVADLREALEGLIAEFGAPAGGHRSRFSLRQPPARLLAMICRNIALSAGALMASPRRTATVRAVLLSWPAVMIPSGSGTIPPS